MQTRPFRLAQPKSRTDALDSLDFLPSMTSATDTHSNTNAPRVIAETGLAARVAAVVEPAVEGLGYQLVRVRISGQNGQTVQIMAERPDGTFTIADCEAVSRDISPALDVDDPVKSAYHLEVSSPGVDRPLVRAIDFKRAVGFEAKIELARAIDTGTGDARRRYRGVIEAALDETVDLTVDTVGGMMRVTLPYEAMDDAKLVMTDALIEAAQKAQDADPIEQDSATPMPAATNDNADTSNTDTRD